jgi:uncharacterized BrkB/YihY/UPF0761 family membrane protein
VVGKLRNLGIAAALTIMVVVMVLVASAGTGILHKLEVDSVFTHVAVPLVSLSITVFICAGVYWSLAKANVRLRAALAGGAVGGVILLATPTAAGYYLRFVAGHTPVELFLMLAGVLFTCYLAALGLLLGAGVTARVQLGRPLGGPSPQSG